VGFSPGINPSTSKEHLNPGCSKIVKIISSQVFDYYNVLKPTIFIGAPQKV